MSRTLINAETQEEIQTAIDDFFAPMEVEPGVFAEYDENLHVWVYTDKDGTTYHIRK